jgi:hypothetical protein
MKKNFINLFDLIYLLVKLNEIYISFSFTSLILRETQGDKSRLV